MPSGAKKRKAAKKKKELLANNNSHGEEALKHESDSEGGSPASQHHHSHFIQGEAEKQLDIDKNRSNGVSYQGKEVEILGTVVQVEGESESHKVNVEPVIESYSGALPRISSSSSSSSSSSEEKHVVADENNVVVESSPAVEVVKENDSFPDTKVNDSLVGTVSTSDLDKAAISEAVIQVTASVSDADHVTSSTDETLLKEQEDKKPAASDAGMGNWEGILDAVVDKTTVSEVLVERGLEKRDAAVNEGSAVSNGNSVANTDAKAFAALETEDKVDQPDNAPTIDVSVCPDNVKDSPAHERQDHPVAVTLPSRPVQATSWKGCCGLFELFAGSNR